MEIEDKVDRIVKYFDSLYEEELSKILSLQLSPLENAIKVSKLQSYIANCITRSLTRLKEEEELAQLDEEVDALIGATQDLFDTDDEEHR